MNSRIECEDSPYCEWRGHESKPFCGKKTYGSELVAERQKSCDQKAIWKNSLGTGIAIAVLVGKILSLVYLEFW